MDVLLLIWILCGAVAAFIAHTKNLNPVTWFALGCVLGVLAVIMLPFMDSKDNA